MSHLTGRRHDRPNDTTDQNDQLTQPINTTDTKNADGSREQPTNAENDIKTTLSRQLELHDIRYYSQFCVRSMISDDVDIPTSMLTESVEHVPYSPKTYPCINVSACSVDTRHHFHQFITINFTQNKKK